MSQINYRFAKNLSKEPIKLKKTVDWFENQTVDKGWNFGFRSYFPKILTQGYQGYMFYGQYLNALPSKEEEKAKVIPSEIITISKKYFKVKKEFFPKLKIKEGPSFYFQDTYMRIKKKYDIKVLLILSGVETLDKKLIEFTNYTMNMNSKIRVVLKCHPILPFNKLKKVVKSKDLDKFEVSYKSLNYLLRKTKISISSGPTSGTLESINNGCYLISPILEPYDALNLKLLNIPKQNYKLVSNKFDLFKEINKNYTKKKIPLKRKKFLFKKLNRNNISMLIR